MDGHVSHQSVDFIEFCWGHKIPPLCLLPHSSHLLQSLDLVIFIQIKAKYSEAVDEFSANGVQGIRKSDFVEIIGRIRPNVLTEDLARSAFRAAGLSPLDRQIVLDRCQRPAQEGQANWPEPPESLLPSPTFIASEEDFDAIVEDNLLEGEGSAHHNTTNVISIEETSYEERIQLYEERLQTMGDGIQYWKQRALILECHNRILERSNRDLRQIADTRRVHRASQRFTAVPGNLITPDGLRATEESREATERARAQKRQLRSYAAHRRRIRTAREREGIEARKAARVQLRVAKDLMDRCEKEAVAAQESVEGTYLDFHEAHSLFSRNPDDSSAALRVLEATEKDRQANEWAELCERNAFESRSSYENARLHIKSLEEARAEENLETGHHESLTHDEVVRESSEAADDRENMDTDIVSASGSYDNFS